MMKIIAVFILCLIFIPAVLLASEREDYEPCTPKECPGEELSAAEQIVQQRLANAAIISIIVGIIVATLLGFYYYKKNRKKWLKKYLPALAVWAVFVLIGFSYYYFQTTASESEGIIVCEAGQCFWAAHIHSQIHAEVCGEEIDFGLEKGPLEGSHTHKERNVIHFHERLQVDPQTREITDFTQLQLGTFFKALNITFTPDCIAGKCNGDFCNNEPGKLTMLVNDEPNSEFDKYIWKDGDEIKIIFE